MGAVAPVFINLHAEFPFFLERDEEDAESHLMWSNKWINSQDIAEGAK